MRPRSLTASLRGRSSTEEQLGSAGMIRRHVVRSSYLSAMLTTRPAKKWQDVHRWQTRRGNIHAVCDQAILLYKKKCNPQHGTRTAAAKPTPVG